MSELPRPRGGRCSGRPQWTGPSGLLPALRQALLPASQQTLLLRACLLRGEPAREAWEAWSAGVPSIQPRLADRRRGARRLLPMLYRSVKLNGLPVDQEILTYLRTATLYEGLRTRTYRRLCRGALAALNAAGVAALTLKGPGLAATAYERWSLRHSHDIDCLVDQSDLPPAVAALASAGFIPTGRRPAVTGAGVVLAHASGMPAHLHVGLFEIPYYRPSLAQIWERSRVIAIAGVPARTLAAPDALVHVVGHAACSRNRETLQWVADASAILERQPDLDWKAVESFALASGLALPLAVMFDYLCTDLGLPVPGWWVERLQAVAARAEPAARDAALAAARVSGRGTLSNLLRATRGWGPRLRLLWWTAFPSPEYVRLSHPVRHSGQLLGYYTGRGLSYLARRLRPPARQA